MYASIVVNTKFERIIFLQECQNKPELDNITAGVWQYKSARGLNPETVTQN
jgi:hypothetical protein